MLECSSETKELISAMHWASLILNPLSCGHCLSLFCSSCSVAKSCPTLCDPMDCSTLGSPVVHHLPEFAQSHVHWVGDAIWPSHPLSPPSPPALNLSQQQSFPMSRLFASSDQSIGASATASALSNDYSGLISFRIDWLDLLAVQGTFKRILQCHSSKASILSSQLYL